MFRALGSRNYRLFFFGQGVSLVGTWMTQLATVWLVYQLSGSPLWLGVVGFAGQAPSFFVAPFSGLLVDRFDRRRILLLTQALAMAQSLALAALTFTGAINLFWLLGLGLFQGLINSVDMPTRQAMVVDMVDRRADLGNAIALNSSLVNAARLVGPALAGIMIATFGAAACFLIDGLSYLPVLASVAALRFAPRPVSREAFAPLTRLREGLAYAWGFAPIRAVLALLAAVSFSGMPYTVLAPIFARDILGGDARTLGSLMSAAGIGALTGGLYLTARTGVRGLGNLIALGPLLAGCGLVGFSLSRNFGLSLACLFAVGLGIILLIASCNTFLQTIVPDEKRGRVMSLYTVAFIGTVPFGNLVAGALASRFGAPTTLAAGGLVCLVASGLFTAYRPRLKPLVGEVYRRLGLIDDPRARQTLSR